MDFKVKIAVAAAFLVLVVAGLLGASYVYSTGAAGNTSQGKELTWAFHEPDFIYGPQASVPYYSPLPVVPSPTSGEANNFKLMFVDLNVSSRQGGSNNNPIAVEYAFTNLSGTAAFHAYGYNQASTNGGGVAWTNRIEGSGSSGYYVTGGSGTSLHEGASVLSNHAYVRVANPEGPAHDDYGNGTYLLNFNKAGGGLNSLHLATSPNSSGEVAVTAAQSGTFYVTAGSDNGFEDVLLLVAVNSTQPHDFVLQLKAYPCVDLS